MQPVPAAPAPPAKAQPVNMPPQYMAPVASQQPPLATPPSPGADFQPALWNAAPQPPPWLAAPGVPVQNRPPVGFAPHTPPTAAGASPSAGALLQLFAIAAVEVTLAVLLAWSSWRGAWEALKYLPAQHDGGLTYRLGMLDGWVTAVVPLSAALVVFGVAIGLLVRAKAAVGVALIAAVSVAFGLAVVAHRTTTQTAALVIAVVLALALAALTRSLPVRRDDDGARRVAAAFSAVLGWAFVGFGVGPIAIPYGVLGGVGFHMRAIGIVEVAFAIGLLLVVHAVRHGNVAACTIATVLLVVLAVTLAMGQRWDRPHLQYLALGQLFAIAAAVCTAVAVWIRPRQSTMAPVTEFLRQPISSAGVWAAFGLSGVIPLVAAAMLVLPHHSENNSYVAQDAPTAAPTYEAPPPTPAAVQPMSRSWTISLTRDGGYSVQAVVSVGAPEHLTDGLANGQDVAGSACDIDAEADAVLPFSVEIRNTTTGFSTVAGLRLGLSPNAESDTPPVEAEMYYTDGSQCSTRSSVDLQSIQPLQPGGGILGNGFLVVHDYYTPNTPDGDASLLVDNPLVVSQSQVLSTDDGTNEQFTVTDITGFDVSSGDDGWVLPLPASVGS